MKSLIFAAHVAIFVFLLGLAVSADAQAINPYIATGAGDDAGLQDAVLPRTNGTGCTAAAEATQTTTIFYGGVGFNQNRATPFVFNTGTHGNQVSDPNLYFNNFGFTAVVKAQVAAGNSVSRFIEGPTTGNGGKFRITIGGNYTKLLDSKRTTSFVLENASTSFVSQVQESANGKWYESYSPLEKLVYDAYGFWNKTYIQDTNRYWSDQTFSYEKVAKTQAIEKIDENNLNQVSGNVGIGFQDKIFVGAKLNYKYGSAKRSVSIKERAINPNSMAFNDIDANGATYAPALGIDYSNIENDKIDGLDFELSGLVRLGNRVRLGIGVSSPTVYHLASTWKLDFTNYTALSVDPQILAPMKSVYQGSLSGDNYKYGWNGPLRGYAGLSYVDPNHIALSMNVGLNNWAGIARYKGSAFSQEFFRTSQLGVQGSVDAEFIFGNVSATLRGGYNRSFIPEKNRQVLGMYSKVASYNPDSFWGGIGLGAHFPKWGATADLTYKSTETLFVPYNSVKGSPASATRVGSTKFAVTLYFRIKTIGDY